MTTDDDTEGPKRWFIVIVIKGEGEEGGERRDLNLSTLSRHLQTQPCPPRQQFVNNKLNDFTLRDRIDIWFRIYLYVQYVENKVEAARTFANQNRANIRYVPPPRRLQHTQKLARKHRANTSKWICRSTDDCWTRSNIGKTQLWRACTYHDTCTMMSFFAINKIHAQLKHWWKKKLSFFHQKRSFNQINRCSSCQSDESIVRRLFPSSLCEIVVGPLTM